VEHVLHVPMTQAALGARVHVETLEGSEEIEIPPGTQSGETMVLRGRGIPQLRGHRRGNFVVRVAVDTPTQLTKAQEELLRHLARERSEEVPEPHEGLLAKLRSARN
jgi:molecular chaperone DnaJ